MRIKKTFENKRGKKVRINQRIAKFNDLSELKY